MVACGKIRRSFGDGDGGAGDAGTVQDATGGSATAGGGGRSNMVEGGRGGDTGHVDDAGAAGATNVGPVENCTPGAKQCDGNQPEVCDVGGAWQASGTPCPFACDPY